MAEYLLMKNTIKIVAYSSIIAIVCLQLIWLYNTYTLTYNDINNATNSLLKQAINREVLLRLYDISVPQGYEIESTPIDGSNDFSFIGFQESLLKLGSSISLADVDSIYTGLLKEKAIQTKSILNIVDAKGNIVESTPKTKHPDTDFFTLETDKIPIRLDHSLSVQAFILHPYQTIFKRMALILLSTALIMLFVGWCIIRQIKVLMTERRIAQWKDTFSRAMIHDMKTPIAGIRMSTQILRNIMPEEIKEREEIISYIEKENEHLYLLAEKALTIARIESGKFSLPKQEFSLKDTVNDLIETFRHRTTKEAEFITTLNADIAYGEPQYIKEAISNLIDNALKYSGEKVRITISSEIKNGILCISVADNGFGIARNERNRIFEKFEQGSNARKQGISGFGLGLNYVKRVSEAHEGRTDMMSRKGYGSIFMIMIPTRIKIEQEHGDNRSETEH